MEKTICIIGAFDTKGEDFSFLRDQILKHGEQALTVNIGILGTTTLFGVDFEAGDVLKAAGLSLENIRARKDKAEAMKALDQGSPKLIRALYDQGKFDGIIGMGGSGGSSIIASAMRALPIGVPKVLVSTVASGDVSFYIRGKDITMIPSIVDVAGLTRVSRLIYARAAGAISGMVETEAPATTLDRPIITASMFGNTTDCVQACSKSLSAKGFEVMVFHATGSGGRAMETLVADGLVEAVLDITTTEWADEICHGIFSAGPERLSAPGQRGIPHLIVPGCVDMANYGAPATVPEKYRLEKRLFYEWNPSVTLMRTNVAENRRMGEIFAQKANAAKSPVAFLIPLRGVSMLDGDGQPFCDREADRAMFNAIKANLKPEIPVVEVDLNINDPAFAARAVDMMLALIQKKEKS
ncbi:MAG: Tm-1-like ATP-binding domain-containing protein [Verrucomicrobia bacterium]|nr:Tm-1-like ATP-binding domain-containing protein [Verrucomicrobiota bacterium]